MGSPEQDKGFDQLKSFFQIGKLITKARNLGLHPT